MRRFNFKLHKLLELKKYREREWEIKLGEITARMEGIRRKIEDSQLRRRESFSLRASAGRDFFQLAAAENYVLRMDQQIIRCNNELKELEKERKTIQAGYIEASKQRKIFEKLREKKEQEYYRAQKKADIRILDDLNSSAAARRIEESGRGARSVKGDAL